MTFFLPQLAQDMKKLLSSNFENEITAVLMVLRFGKS